MHKMRQGRTTQCYWRRRNYLTGPGGAGVTVSEATAQMFDPNDPNRPVKAFLQEYQTLFGFGPEAITNATVQRDDVSAGNGARTVVWQQQVAGVPVFDAPLIGHYPMIFFLSQGFLCRVVVTRI
jgi:hypothetical protein